MIISIDGCAHDRQTIQPNVLKFEDKRCWKKTCSVRSCANETKQPLLDAEIAKIRDCTYVSGRADSFRRRKPGRDGLVVTAEHACDRRDYTENQEEGSDEQRAHENERKCEQCDYERSI